MNTKNLPTIWFTNKHINKKSLVDKLSQTGTGLLNFIVIVLLFNFDKYVYRSPPIQFTL